MAAEDNIGIKSGNNIVTKSDIEIEKLSAINQNQNINMKNFSATWKVYGGRV